MSWSELTKLNASMLRTSDMFGYTASRLAGMRTRTKFSHQVPENSGIHVDSSTSTDSGGWPRGIMKEYEINVRDYLSFCVCVGVDLYVGLQVHNSTVM